MLVTAEPYTLVLQPVGPRLLHVRAAAAEQGPEHADHLFRASRPVTRRSETLRSAR